MNEIILYLVGKMKMQDSTDSARLLLYAAFRAESDAKEYIKEFSDKYYKQRPHLCPLVIEKIIK